MKTIERVLGLGLRMSLMVTFLFFVGGFFFPETVMRCFTNDNAILAEGVTYLRITAVSYLFIGLSNVFVSVIRSVEKVVLPTVVYIVSLVINVTLNATFIFGLFGMPKLGLTGVAIGTLTARVVEALICVIYSRVPSEIRIRVKHIFFGAGVLLKDYLSVSLPSLINDVFWSLAASTYTVVMGHLGSDIVAANAVAAMAVNIGAMICRAFASATTIIVSKPMGAGDLDRAKVVAGRMLWLTTMLGVVACGIVVAICPLMTALYRDKLTETAIGYLNMMMILRGIQLIGEQINTCLICGCFRGGGDARFGMILDITYMWLIEVPILLLAAFVFKLSVLWCYFIICFDEFGKMAPVVMHYLSFKWLHDITRSEEELAK